MKWAILTVGIIWAVCAWFDVGSQRKVFMDEGRQALSDWWMTRDCLRGGYIRDDGREGSGWVDNGELTRYYRTGLEFRTGSNDRVYPALALLPVGLFPDTWAGGWCFTVCAAIVFLVALLPSAGKRAGFIVPLVFSMPFLFSVERGNPVWLSAAGVAIFLAWWDDEVRWRRYAAAICLAVAAVMKISPAVLGVVYLSGLINCKIEKSKDCRIAEPVVFAASAIILFAVPWLFVKDGFAAIPVCLKNAAHNGDICLRQAAFGLVSVWRAIRQVMGDDVMSVWPGMTAAARISQAVGFAAVIYGAWRRRYVLLVGGMLMAAGNMFYYGALYLLPVFMLEGAGKLKDCRTEKLAMLRSGLWFVLLCPLQFVLKGSSCNPVLGNLAVMSLMALDCLKGDRR